MTAVAPVVVDCKGIWVGWTGLDDFDDRKDAIPESPEDDRTPTAGLRSSQARTGVQSVVAAPSGAVGIPLKRETTLQKLTF